MKIECSGVVSASPAHALDAAQVLVVQNVSRARGLPADEVAARLTRHGLDVMPPPRRRSAFMRFMLQFHNVLIYVLLLAGAVTAALGHWVDSGVILDVVPINAVIGFVQEGKAERALGAIRTMLSPNAQVLRDGRRVEIAAERVVPGDIVFLVSGDKVPADLRLIEVRNLRVEEAVLTGESLPVGKAVAPVVATAPLGERTCMAYSGTLVMYGQGWALLPPRARRPKSDASARCSMRRANWQRR